jgi:hypothetical protein
MSLAAQEFTVRVTVPKGQDPRALLPLLRTVDRLGRPSAVVRGEWGTWLSFSTTSAHAASRVAVRLVDHDEARVTVTTRVLG